MMKATGTPSNLGGRETAAMASLGSAGACMFASYECLLFSSLYLACAAAVCQLVLAFIPRFSVIALGNGLLLTTVFVPLATNQLSLGTQIGTWLWFGNVCFYLLLLARWTVSPEAARAYLPMLGSLFGMLTFGLHVFLFAACP
jgi:hypothetical protein